MDLDKLHQLAMDTEDEERIHRFPELVKERVLHADADIFSYKACDMESSYGGNVIQLKELIEVWRKLAGAQYIYLHLTMGTKGGREQIAKVKKYQGQRIQKQDHEKQERVHDLREFMMDYTTPFTRSVANFDQEADDSLCQAMWLSKETGSDDVLFSSDKDLWMVGGKHLNANTFEIEEFPWGYGKCDFSATNSGTKKLIGKGTSWFWHQMLMGDPADNIPGLLFMDKDMVIKFAPTKSIADAQRKLSSGRMPSGSLMNHQQKATALSQYNDLYNKADAKKVGPVLAHKYLQNCLTDRMAYQYVLEAYQDWYGKVTPKYHSFYSWDNVRIECTPYAMFLEQARLLWMRREIGQDVEEWFKEILNG